MNDFIKSMNGLPQILKILLALPVLDIIWVIYRLIKSLANNNALGIIIAVILIVVGIPFLWLIDMITLIVNDNILWID